MDDVLKLVNTCFKTDEYGVERKERTEREVFCKVDSVTRTEFFNGGRNGLNPSLVFTIFAGDYCEEIEIEYCGKYYAVYRDYYIPGTDYLELYAERKGGTNGAKDTYKPD